MVAPFQQMLGRPENRSSWAELAVLDRLADVLLRAPHVPVGLARSATEESARSRLKLLRHHGILRNEAWKIFEGS